MPFGWHVHLVAGENADRDVVLPPPIFSQAFLGFTSMPLKIPTTTNIDAINAKLHARRSRFYEKDRLARLCELPDFEAFSSLLFPGEEIKDHRLLQKRLVENHIYDLLWVVNYLGGREFRIFLWLLQRYQLENLKIVFRGFYSRRDPAEIIPFLVNVPDALGLPVEKMVQAESIEEFRDAIPQPSLRRMLRAPISLFGRKSKPFYFEAALDKLFYTEMLKLLNGRQATSKRSRFATVNVDATIYVIMVIVRAKHNYGASFDDIAPVIDIGHGLPSGLARAVYAAESMAAVVEALPAGLRRYARTPVETIDELERALLCCLYERATFAFSSMSLDLNTTFAFYYLKRIELLNLVRLSEAHHYRVGPEEMKSIMIPPVE